MVLALVGWAAMAAFGSDPQAPSGPAPGTPEWARAHYGNPNVIAARSSASALNVFFLTSEGKRHRMSIVEATAM